MRRLLVVAGLALMLAGCKEEDESIPTPPPGYEYCVTSDGQGLEFCRKETT